MPLDGTTTPTTEIILGAIERLERYGWCQGHTMNGDERCVYGAIKNAVWHQFFGQFLDEGLVRATMRRVERANGIPDEGIAFWNDEPGRTKEGVIEALYRAL